MIRWIRKHRWLSILLLIGAIAIILFGRPTFFIIRAAMMDRDERRPLPSGIADDVSRLNATPISERWDMPPGEDAESQLRDLLSQARRLGLHISIVGARHSMGGQTLYPNGIQINMLPYRRMTLDEGQNILEVQAGALWADVVPFLDKHQRAVAVMQASNSFTIGGSLSVNCHGWQPGRAPIASTVESFRIMNADGTILRCSRTKNAELFSLALGGYGLFGVILDARIHVVPNERYELHQSVFPTAQFLGAWKDHVIQSQDVGLALGRLSVVPSDFLNQSLLYTFTCVQGALPPLSDPGLQKFARYLFLGSVDSDYGKQLRWNVESQLTTHLAKTFYSRTQLQSISAEVMANRTADTTDILQEYFIPYAGFDNFVVQMRSIIPHSGGNLLNVTLRDVRQDPDTFLRYADRDMIALVLLFHQRLAGADESRMQQLTQQLIDAALLCGGRYYLPYRLEATAKQFSQAYPQAKKFFELKRQYDPTELFQNEMYVKYGLQSGSESDAK